MSHHAVNKQMQHATTVDNRGLTAKDDPAAPPAASSATRATKSDILLMCVVLHPKPYTQS